MENIILGIFKKTICRKRSEPIELRKTFNKLYGRSILGMRFNPEQEKIITLNMPLKFKLEPYMTYRLKNKVTQQYGVALHYKDEWHLYFSNNLTKHERWKLQSNYSYVKLYLEQIETYNLLAKEFKYLSAENISFLEELVEYDENIIIKPLNDELKKIFYKTCKNKETPLEKTRRTATYLKSIGFEL